MVTTRTALISGGSRNIGFALGRSLASKGHRVVLNARTQDALDAAAASLADLPGEVIGIAADVSDRSQVDRIVEQVNERFGGIDVLVNAAHVRVHRPFLELSIEEWQTSIDISLTGAFHVTQAVLGGMVERGWGRIVNFSGVTAQTGSLNRAGIIATKAALIGLTRALALEFAETGVTVNAISPGLIGTDRGEWTSQGDQDFVQHHYASRVQVVPMKRMGRVEEVAAAFDWLVSDDAAFVTGQTINVNGGLFFG